MDDGDSTSTDLLMEFIVLEGEIALTQLSKSSPKIYSQRDHPEARPWALHCCSPCLRSIRYDDSGGFIALEIFNHLISDGIEAEGVAQYQ